MQRIVATPENSFRWSLYLVRAIPGLSIAAFLVIREGLHGLPLAMAILFSLIVLVVSYFWVRSDSKSPVSSEAQVADRQLG